MCPVQVPLGRRGRYGDVPPFWETDAQRDKRVSEAPQVLEVSQGSTGGVGSSCDDRVAALEREIPDLRAQIADLQATVSELSLRCRAAFLDEWGKWEEAAVPPKHWDEAFWDDWGKWDEWDRPNFA